MIITEGPVVQSGTGCIIKNWDGYYKVGQFYHRVGWVLKMGQLLQSRPEHNNFLRTKSQEDKLKYNKQQNLCKKLLRATKKRLSLKRGFGGYGHGFDGRDGLGGLADSAVLADLADSADSTDSLGYL